MINEEFIRKPVLTNQEFAEAAISQLRQGVMKKNPLICVLAYEMIENKEDFTWEGIPEHIIDQWEALLDQASIYF